MHPVVRILLVLLAIGHGVITAYAAQPWDQPFAPDTRAILDRAKGTSLGENPSAVILLDEHRYSIRADGRSEATIRKVYRIALQDAVEEWASVEQSYQPWYQQEPEIRARVIAASGGVQWLDSKTIASAPARQFDASIFSDSRVARAPLPGVAAGSVVEYEIKLRDKVPLLDAGVTRRIAVWAPEPMERFHAVIESDTGVALRTNWQLIPDGKCKREDLRGAARVECDFGPIVPSKDVESNLPFDKSEYPYLSFSTGNRGRAWPPATRQSSIRRSRVQTCKL